MKTFTDAKGRKWNICLNLAMAIHVKEKLGIDLLQPEIGDPPLLTKLGTDEYLLAQVICALIDKQIEETKITEEDVIESFDGKTLFDAHAAFYEELIDFFQSRGRTDRSMTVAKQKRALDAAIQAVTKKVESIDIESKIDGAISGVTLEQ